MFECIGSHEAIKSAFFVFGLNGYNCRLFLEHVSREGIPPLIGGLSPEDSELSYHQFAPLSPDGFVGAVLDGEFASEEGEEK